MEESPIPYPGPSTPDSLSDTSPRASYTGSLRTPFLIDDSGARDTSVPDTTINKPVLTFFNGLALVAGLQIGSGIFFAPSQVSNHVPSPGAGVLVWVVGGLLVWTGASSFAELGIAIPRNGGIQEYLVFCYGDFAGFLFSLMWVVVTAPAANAMIGTVFAEHVCSAFVPEDLASVWWVKSVALVGLWVITGVNCHGARTGAWVANGFLVLKLCLICSIVGIGIVVAVRGTGGGVPRDPGGWFGQDAKDDAGSLWLTVGGYVTALYGALFCYGGYYTLGFVAGEMKNPTRDVPRVLHSAMAIVMTGFVLVNIALYVVLPIQFMREHEAVAVGFGAQVLGPVCGFAYSLAIAASAMGALNVNAFAGGRLCAAASKRGYFPKVLGNKHYTEGDRESDYYRKTLQSFPVKVRVAVIAFAERTSRLRLQLEVPIYAMIMNALLASFYILIGSFSGLVTFVGIAEYMCFFFAVLGIVVVRSKATASTASYRTYTFNPIVFCVVSGFLVVRGVITDVLQGVAIFSVGALGWLVYRRFFHGLEG